MAKVKICGNTNTEDVRQAIELGADYIGFIFAASKRQISKETALEIVAANSEFNSFVGVFFNQSKDQVDEIIQTVPLQYLQFHGEETALYCDYFLNKGYKIIKTFRIKDEMSLKRVEDYNVTAYLFDTFEKSAPGGTGKTFDWSVIQKKAYVHDQLFLAGGLSPDNVLEAIRTVKPFAVDVASGVETEPGKKDLTKLQSFIQKAKIAETPTHE